MSSSHTRFITDSNEPAATRVLSAGRLSALDLPARRSPAKVRPTLATPDATSHLIVESAWSRLRVQMALLLWRGMVLGIWHSLPRCALPSLEKACSDMDHASRQVGRITVLDHERRPLPPSHMFLHCENSERYRRRAASAAARETGNVRRM